MTKNKKTLGEAIKSLEKNIPMYTKIYNSKHPYIGKDKITKKVLDDVKSNLKKMKSDYKKMK